MRRALLLLAILATLGIAGCGGDDEPGAVDLAEFTDCVEEDGEFDLSEDETIGQSLETRPEASFNVSSTDEEADIADLVVVLVFDSTEKAVAAESEIPGEGRIKDHEGSVVWVSIEDEIDEQLDDTIRRCAGG